MFALTFFLVMSFVRASQSQGVFLAGNPGNQTRLGSLDGAFAGTNIYGLFLAGPTAASLGPVGLVMAHVNGRVPTRSVSVPSVPPYSYAFVQFVAWDAGLWGTDWLAVPADQFGRTDIVQVFLTTGIFPDVTLGPQFTQPAIVPVPEPAGWALVAVAVGAAALAGRRGKKGLTGARPNPPSWLQ